MPRTRGDLIWSKQKFDGPHSKYFAHCAYQHSIKNHRFYLTLGTSFMLLAAQAWPVVYSIFEHGSFVEGMRNRKHPAFKVKRIDKRMRRFEGFIGLRVKAERAAGSQFLSENPIFTRATEEGTSQRKRATTSTDFTGEEGDIGLQRIASPGPGRITMVRQDMEQQHRKSTEELQRSRARSSARHQAEISAITEATEELERSRARSRARSSARHREEIAQLKAKLAEAEARVDRGEREGGGL